MTRTNYNKGHWKDSIKLIDLLNKMIVITDLRSKVPVSPIIYNQKGDGEWVRITNQALSSYYTSFLTLEATM